MRRKKWQAGRMIALCLAAAVLAATGAGPRTAAAAPDSARPERTLRNFYALGVYWSWERTAAMAANAGRDFWEFVEDTLRRLKEDYNCNLVWIVNISPDNALRVCDIAGEHGLKIMVNTNPFLDLTYGGITGVEQVRAAARQAYETLGTRDALAAYVLRDEPRRWLAGQMEWFRREMSRVDPSRDSIVVTMNLDTEAYAHQTNFPVLCMDIYPFGGDRSPWLPNPAAASQRYYRDAWEAMTAEAHRTGKWIWTMPQAYADFWGPWWYDADGNVVIEPGTYHHWRMPTVAETRWQIWEGVRTGCKGVVFFVLSPAVNAWDGEGEIPETGDPRIWERRLQRVRAEHVPVVGQRTRTGHGTALLHRDGRPTPQLEETGRVFGTLAGLEELLLSLEPADFPAAFSEGVFAVGTFASGSEPGRRFVVVVNDDLEEARAARVHFLPHTASVRDLVSGRAPALERDEAGGTLSARLALEPGDGTVLELAFAGNEPGVLLLDEDFSIATLGVTMKNAVRGPERRGFGTGWDWKVRRETGLPPEAKSELVIGRVSEPGGATGGVLVSPATELDVYLSVSGTFPAPESLVLEWSGPGEAGGWLMSNNYHLPARIPQGVREVALKFGEGVALGRILIFAIPREAGTAAGN